MYILDEPSIGLHPKDTERLIKVISLRDLGNTVIVVDDEDIMKAADMIIDIGPSWFLWWRISCSRYF
jgi:excinuclease ABC subunit A